MATNPRIPEPGRLSLDAMRKYALIAGVLYLITFLASIPAVFLLGPVLDDPAYILGPGADTQVLLGAFLDLITALACIGTAVALYPVIRRQSQAASIGFIATRSFEGAVIVIGVVSIMAVVMLRDRPACPRGPTRPPWSPWARASSRCAMPPSSSVPASCPV